VTNTAAHDADYNQGLRDATVAVIHHSLHYLSGVSDSTVPPDAITQVRRAVQHRVGIETVMLRYIAGHGRFSEFVRDVSNDVDISTRRRLLARQDELLKNLTSTIALEYRREQQRQRGSSDQDVLNAVRIVLEGGQVAIPDYDLENTWHMGFIASGQPDASLSICEALASRYCGKLLSVSVGTKTTWGWLGTPSQVDVDYSKCEAISLAVGRSAFAVDGWRSTHYEAQIARSVALHRGGGRGGSLVRCADVLLEAAVLRDETISEVLMRDFLVPLDSLQMSGGVARQTVAVYLKCQLNVAKTAAVLKVNRKTIEGRLREIENVLARPLSSCFAELGIAMRLEKKL
jgi:hypothetical protein